MNAFDTAVKFFQDSGLFIYPSIFIMAVGLAIAIERFVFLQRARSENRRMRSSTTISVQWSWLAPDFPTSALRMKEPVATYA